MPLRPVESGAGGWSREQDAVWLDPHCTVVSGRL